MQAGSTEDPRAVTAQSRGAERAARPPSATPSPSSTTGDWLARMRQVLILGGTAWLGRAIAAHAVAQGATVTCLARGESGDIAPGARLVRADRNDPAAYDDVKRRDWDEVVELSWDPGFVASALDALADRAAHWTLVSSVSVHELHRLAGLTLEEESAVLLG